MVKYISEDLAIIIPTKDRPKQINRHLTSLVTQNCKIGRLIIVDSGSGLEEIVLNFKKKLPVEHYYSPPGQVRQRNLGISMLDGSTKLVAWMDDDITYDEGSINNMINFWNQVDSKTVGVGFNIIYKNKSHSIFNSIINMINKPGSVNKSGHLNPFVNLSKNIEVQYLNGGATVWKYNILKEYKHDNNLLDLKWAVCEDCIYSYPIGKKFKLMACADSKVETEDEIQDTKNKKEYFFNRGKKRYSMRLYFVLINSDLSRALFFLSQWLYLFKLGLKLILFLDKQYLYSLLGTLNGMVSNIDVLLLIQNPKEIIKRTLR